MHMHGGGDNGSGSGSSSRNVCSLLDLSAIHIYTYIEVAVAALPWARLTMTRQLPCKHHITLAERASARARAHSFVYLHTGFTFYCSFFFFFFAAVAPFILRFIFRCFFSIGRDHISICRAAYETRRPASSTLAATVTATATAAAAVFYTVCPADMWVHVSHFGFFFFFLFSFCHFGWGKLNLKITFANIKHKNTHTRGTRAYERR